MTTAATPETGKMSELGRLTGVIWSPGEAFRDIIARPRWWPPLVLIAVLSLAFTYTFTQHVGWERFMRQQIETNSRTQNMPADQRDQIIAQQAKFAPVISYVFSVIGIPIMALITASVFLFIFKTLLNADLSFKKAYAITCYAMLPLVLSTVMALAVMLMKNPEDFDLNYPTLTNIGAFMDPLHTPKWLLSLGSSIDIFTLWILALLATGFAATGRKISWGTSMACVVAAWAVLVLIKVGWNAAFA
ncbi:MAG TPA: Yip1 family protein [Bryobacteraceae bacterium]|nr:Yip1 family protein [Bryobacteraceae bacterium]